jgi:uncharacterized RDD family membrane protein YckC
MPKIKIHTAQNVTIEYELASIGDRFVALLIDGFILTAYIIAMIILLSKLNINDRLTWTLVVLPYIFYDLIAEILLEGQTIGKKVMNIKVIKIDGTSPTVSSYFMRWLIRLFEVSLFSGIIALIAMATSTYTQRLGDMAAGTCVIKNSHKYQTYRPELADISDEEMYEPYFSNIAILSDKDIDIVREVLASYKKTANYQLVQNLHQRLQEVLTAQDSPLPPLDFLKQVLKDYDNVMYRK